MAALLIIPKAVFGAPVDDDEICNRLDAFDRAPFPSGVTQAPRSVVFLWKPSGILGTAECVHHSEPNAKALCGWLMENTSREFSEVLPERILSCHGFGFPRHPNVGDWIADYEFIDEKTMRWLRLDVARGQIPDVDAIRWTVLPDGKDNATLPLSPLKDELEAKVPAN
ncbi:MAG: hypothetical protein WDN01_17610 [Rhizomicrobium sp.]